MVGRATDRSRKQMGNVPLENRVRFEADDVEGTSKNDAAGVNPDVPCGLPDSGQV